eukprot:scaffold17703_cov119-Isochrysis_galbana.AAC.4
MCGGGRDGGRVAHLITQHLTPAIDDLGPRQSLKPSPTGATTRRADQPVPCQRCRRRFPAFFRRREARRFAGFTAGGRSTPCSGGPRRGGGGCRGRRVHVSR